jgi:hypothetical protein
VDARGGHVVAVCTYTDLRHQPVGWPYISLLPRTDGKPSQSFVSAHTVTCTSTYKQVVVFVVQLHPAFGTVAACSFGWWLMAGAGLF